MTEHAAADIESPDGEAIHPTTLVVLDGARAAPPPAAAVLSAAQKVILVAGLVALPVATFLWPVPTIVAVNGALITFFVAANTMKLLLIRRSLDYNAGIDQPDASRVPDHELPVYTILLPVYHEAAVLEHLMTGIAQLDYPAHLLDIKLLLERDDAETREAVDSISLPANVDVLVVPDVGPVGKPRACNHGLDRARGEYLVIYDAEDRPEPDQLRRSVAAFRAAPDDVVCLQAKLNYFNRAHNLLTRWFTAEYSVWFDQFLPGLQAMDVAIPLGGTSNHFRTSRLRELDGWNAYNVTEDADLGMRIFLHGWKTAVLESTTYEEAPSTTYNWIRQRSRWAKGYMQTYLFFMRNPIRLARQMGAKAFTMFQLFFGAGTLCLLLNPIYWVMTIAWYVSHLAGIELIFPWPVLYIGTAGLFLGNASLTLSALSGCFARHNYEDVKWAVLAPVYWILMSVGAWKALIQLCYKPHYWEKTVHGVCLYNESVAGDLAVTPET